MIDKSLIAAIAPRPRAAGQKRKNWDAYVDALLSPEATELLVRFGITTKLRLVHVLANWAHETGGFTIVRELGAYSATQLMKTFGVGRHSARITKAESRRLAYNGPAIFERVYGLGNPRKARELGNTAPGDGWKFRGCGVVQITGRRDHERYAAAIGCPVEALSEPLNSIHAALLEWQDKNLNNWADQDNTKQVRRLINGGYNGLPDVRAKHARLMRIVPDEWTIEPTAVAVGGAGSVASAGAATSAAVLEMRLGSEGPEVAKLQERLIAHGYYVGRVDGDWGAATEKQFIAWQVQHGFEPTGVYRLDDPEQTAALNADPKPTPERNITAADLKESGSRTIQTTSIGKRVLGWVFGGNVAMAADDVGGLGIADAVVTQAEKVQGLATRGIGLVQMPSSKWIAMIIICAAAAAIYYAFSRIEAYRTEDANTGKHMG